MKKYANDRFLSILALTIGILSISVGFAAYSTSLNIKSYYIPNQSEFNVNFSTSVDKTTIDPVVGVLSNEGISGFYADKAIITNTESGSTISGLNAHFTEPGQSVKYVFYAINDGKYTAYLKQVHFKNIDGKSTTKICRGTKETSTDLVSSTCENINIEIKVRDTLFKNESNKSKIVKVDSHLLGVATTEKIEVIITYNKSKNDSVVRPDGPFYVEFGDILLIYNSIDK